MSSMILSNNGLASFDWQQVVYNQIVQRKSGEYEEASTKLQTAMEGKNAYFDGMSSRYAAAKASINNADIAVENGQKGVETIKTTLLSLRNVIGAYAEAKDDETKTALRSQFDNAIDQINRTADMYAKAYNPIGNVSRTTWDPNTISFTSDLMKPDVEMTGTYAGADYYIEAEDGTLWVPEPGTSTITEYTSFSPGSEAGTTKGDGFASTRGGLELNHYKADTGKITFTVNPNSDAPRTISGTLKTGGLDLMQSWFYDLDSEEGRKTALDAVSSAQNRLVGMDAKLTSMATTVKSENAKVTSALAELSANRSDATRQQIEESYTAQVKVQQELQALQSAFAAMTEQKQNYSSMFSSVSISPLFDLTA